jgi:purine-binding chemotaxis protein CheW
MSALPAKRGDDADELLQFLTFRLGDGEYGVGILSVREIRGWTPVTAIPHSPVWLLGVINLRGAVVPIVDLRIKFGLSNAEYEETTVVIVLNVAARVIGVVVDAVSDVITLSRGDIKPAPELGGNTDTSHIIGFGTLDERMRILMDVEKLMAGADLGAVAGTLTDRSVNEDL